MLMSKSLMKKRSRSSLQWKPSCRVGVSVYETKNHKDFGTQKALIKLVGKRRSLLDYLKDRDIERYRAIIKELNLRK